MADILNQLPAFLLILMRISSFFVTVPLFSYRNIPSQHKIALAIVLTWLVFYSIEVPTLSLDGQFLLLLGKEIIIGLGLGLIAMMMIMALQVAGNFIDLQMGFAIANVLDPQTGVQSPLIGQYFYTFTLLFVLTTDAHHLLIDGIFQSYQVIPIDHLFLPFSTDAVAAHAIETFTTMFLIAFQMAIPIVGSLFLVDVALGIIARTVPQVNVFVIGLPLKIFASFIMLIIVMPILFLSIQKLVEEMINVMHHLIQLTGGV